MHSRPSPFHRCSPSGDPKFTSSYSTVSEYSSANCSRSATVSAWQPEDTWIYAVTCTFLASFCPTASVAPSSPACFPHPAHAASPEAKRHRAILDFAWHSPIMSLDRDGIGRDLRSLTLLQNNSGRSALSPCLSAYSSPGTIIPSSIHTTLSVIPSTVASWLAMITVRPSLFNLPSSSNTSGHCPRPIPPWARRPGAIGGHSPRLGPRLCVVARRRIVHRGGAQRDGRYSPRRGCLDLRDLLSIRHAHRHQGQHYILKHRQSREQASRA